MNRQQIRQRILTALNDDSSAPVLMTPALANQSIAEAVEVLAEEVPAWTATYTLPRRQGQMLYSLPGVGENIQAPARLWLPDLSRRLEPVEMSDLDARHELWMTVSGDPWYWFPVDWRTFGVWPIPASGGGWLQVDAYVWPAPLLDDGDEVRHLELADHEALVFYGEMEGYLRQWEVARAVDLWQAFTSRWGSARSGAAAEAMTARGAARPVRQSARREDL